MSFAPTQQRYLRACMRFRDEGCPNCDDFLHLTHSPEQIEACTSQVFEGVITLANPSRSWVAKWQRLDGYVPGLYAIKVAGQLSDEIRQVLEDEYRIQYIPRDGSATEADA
ncbi:probable Transcription elongation factor spt-4 [Cephalotrichum gorgonifer]|uniref:Transcription elongation factor SPT4 n=1 Tax=Cephalotrichum gorgonifer TaxID=2041049 RepID=A0AAE8SRH4_9PEZI|nr:probable Transcription elongation factor spt-4 [Cephalotrichum gorgonifer]